MTERTAYRPLWPPGAETAAQAFDTFEAWRRDRDPDGKWNILEALARYAERPVKP